MSNEIAAVLAGERAWAVVQGDYRVIGTLNVPPPYRLNTQHDTYRLAEAANHSYMLRVRPAGGGAWRTFNLDEQGYRLVRAVFDAFGEPLP